MNVVERRQYLAGRIDAQATWILEHGGTLQGYQRHYGPSVFPARVEQIYNADRATLERLKREYKDVAYDEYTLAIEELGEEYFA